MGKTSSAMAGSEPSKRLHSSLNSHLETELTLLRALIDRSKFQHRSQPFLRKMREVYRLGQRVRDTCASEQLDEIKLKQLLPKLIHVILKAAVSTQQIIELEHFLPTHIPVLAIYGRLFALSAHLASYLSLDLERILGGESGIEEPVVTSTLSTLAAFPVLADASLGLDLGESSAVGQSGPDYGQKIARPVSSSVMPAPDRPSPSPSPVLSSSKLIPSSARPSPTVPAQTPSRSRSPSVALEQDSPDPEFPEIALRLTEPSPVPSDIARERTSKIIKKKKRTPTETAMNEKTKKKKKRNDIDDIFGF